MSSNRLKRSSTEKVVAGVLGGLAEWLGWDITMVRVIYALVSIFSTGFPGLLVYLILWVAMPSD